MKFIGITMRVSPETQYEEIRDAISWDWYRFFHQYFPDVQLILLPNSLDLSQSIFDKFTFDGIIISGGNDIGQFPQRDEVERWIIQKCIDDNIGCIGVCRGMQMIANHFDFKITSLDSNLHVNQAHDITTHDGDIISVNSYHSFGLPLQDISPFTLQAYSADGYIESMTHQDRNLYGLMWHPERPHKSIEHSLQIFRKIFSL